MALKVLQIICAIAVVLIVLLIIPVMLRLKRTLEEVGRMVNEVEPGAMKAIREAGMTLESVNEELDNIDKVAGEAMVIIDKLGEAADSIENTVKSPLARAGLISTGAAVTSLAVKKHLKKKAKKTSKV